ncbi:MAG: LTA synthase family protein [Butyrivibrio sp.]|nr:LTA synthase family protein [Butyrivibrio sp.]
MLFYIFFFIFAALGIVSIQMLEWFKKKFGCTFQETMYTIASPMGGADASFMLDCFWYSRVCIVIFLAVFIVVVAADNSDPLMHAIGMTFSDESYMDEFAYVHVMMHGRAIYRWCCMILGIALVIYQIIQTDKVMGIFEYFKMRLSRTDLYDKYYVAPESVKITFEDQDRNTFDELYSTTEKEKSRITIISNKRTESNESLKKINSIDSAKELKNKRPKNLIYIYMESMESTYSSAAEGGYQGENNYIPNLTKMAKDNVSFSEDEKLGGFHTVPGTQWTMAALFGTQAGVPNSFPLKYVAKDPKDYAAGIKTLGDVLHEKGYEQEFLCGSKAGFGGRASFFKTHGNFNIFDYDSAVEKGYIEKGYKVWWGFEDSILYKCAKDELTNLAAKGKPFNFTMLTVDTHHIDGYICDKCEHKHKDRIANVLECADRQIQEFIEWCKEQDFMKDTVIVITGDHPRMDKSIVGHVDYYDRTVYNCFIGVDNESTFGSVCGNTSDSINDTSAEKENMNAYNIMKNREFLHFDIFPTVLSALGFKIEGERLGLGTNLFSGKKTLCEEKGFKYMRDESFKYSDKYVKDFE